MIRLPVTALYGEKGLKGTNRPGTIVVSTPSLPAGGSLTVREVDGDPTGTATTIEFPNGSLTFPSTGVARLALPGSGTVTSVAASGGTTGFTFSGGPITSSGTLTMAVGNASTIRAAIGAGTSNFDGAYGSLSGIPSTFTPSAHNQAWSTITGTPTTLSGYGITDAQPLDADLTAIAALTGTNTIYYRSGAGTWSAVTIGDNLTFSSGKLSASVSGGGGTVTSVDVSGGTTGLTFSGGPITGSGVVTLAVGNAATFRSAIGAGTSSFDGAYSSLTGVPSTFAPSAHSHAIADTTGLQAALDLKAPLASPALTGTPTAPTATAGTNTTQLATTAFVRAEVTALVAAAPTTLDTLNELAAALGNDPNFATTIANSLAGKQPLEATLTGIAATTPAADQIIYSTGNDTFAVTSLTAFARSILDDADAATVRATIGAAAASHTHGNITNAGAIGSTANLPLITTTGGAITVGSFGNTANTFCQGNDSRLSDARTPTAHTHPASDISDSTATGRAVVTATDAAAARAAIAARLPTILTDDGVTTLASSGAVAVDASAKAVYDLNPTGNVTLSVTNSVNGSAVSIRIGASAFSITWSITGLIWVGGSTPTLPTATGRKIIVALKRFASNDWVGMVTGEAY